MAEQIKDGGPAFPGDQFALVVPTEYRDDPRIHEIARKMNGMTLRDYFAAKAMQTALTACANDARDEGVGYCDHVATVSYEMADAMLKARL